MARLGRPVPSCNVRILVGFGKGKPLRKSPLRRSINPAQATAAIQAAAGRYFAAYTVTPTAGVYMNEGEPAVAIDVFRTQFDPPGCAPLIQKARCLASDLRSVLRQHSVLVVASDGRGITSDLIMKGRQRGCPIDSSAAARRFAIEAASRTP